MNNKRIPLAFVLENGARVGYAVRKTDAPLEQLAGDEFADLTEACQHFIKLYGRDFHRMLTRGDVEISWGYFFDMPVKHDPVLHYWPTEAGNRDAWNKHDALKHMVTRLLVPSRWCLEEDMSGAWLWHQRGTLSTHENYTGLSGYATPEWEGCPGIAFAKLDENGTYESDEQVTLTLELTGDLYSDALRIILKVTNQFERGY